MLRKLLDFLLSPTAKYSVLVLLGGGFIVGVGSVIAFDITMYATNTEEFCTSCHEMRDNPGMLLKGTTHFKNKSGVRPTCSDCHVPLHPNLDIFSHDGWLWVSPPPEIPLTSLKQDAAHAIYRERIYQETLPLKRAMYAKIFGK